MESVRGQEQTEEVRNGRATTFEVLRLLHQAAVASRRVNELCAQRRARLGIQSIFENLE
jgi:hypothetical protein